MTKNYLQIKGIESNLKTVDDAMTPIIDIILNDMEFRNFTFDNYMLFIYYDKKDKQFYVKKIADEMLVLIKKIFTILIARNLRTKLLNRKTSIKKRQ